MWFIDLLKELHKQGATAMGLAGFAVLAVGYHQFWTLPAFDIRTTGVEQKVTDIRESQLEQRLDQAYQALCSRPGDPDILQRVRELQQQYEMVLMRRYPQPSCELLGKLSH